MKKETINAILGLLKKHHEIGIDLGVCEELQLWDVHTEDDFNRNFIIPTRIKPLLILKILDKLCTKDDLFYVAREKSSFIEYVDKYDENVENWKQVREIIMGTQVCTNVFTYKEIWNSLLAEQGFEQIITSDAFNLEIQEYIDINETKTPETNPVTLEQKWAFDTSSLYIIHENFIISENTIIISNEETEGIIELIKKYEANWHDFVQKQHIAVDHETYIVWLQQNFPNKIQIRMLE